MTPTEIGALLLALFSVFYFLGRLPTVTAAAGFFGVILVGESGWIGHSLATVASWLQTHVVLRLTADILGAPLTFLVAVVLGVIFVHDLHPKHTTGRRTAWIGVALGALIVAGVTGIPALNGLRSQIVTAVSTL